MEFTTADFDFVSGDSVALRVRFGFDGSDIGLRDGFQENPVCNDVIPGLMFGSPQTIYCHVPLSGRILSIMSVDPVTVNQLRLCDLKIF